MASTQQPASRSLVLIMHGTELGGAELNLLAFLQQLRVMGWRLALVTCNRGVLFERFQAAVDDLLVVPLPYARKPASWIHMPAFLRKGRAFMARQSNPQILLAGDFYALWNALWLRPKGAAVFSLWQGEYNFGGDSSARKWKRYGADRADCLLASDPIARHLNQMGMTSQKVETLNPFVDDQRLNPALYDRQEQRSRFGWPQDAHIAICVGRVGEGKRQLWLARRFMENRSFPMHARLVIVGPGSPSDIGQLTALSEQTGDRVLMMETREDIPELLAAADLAIQPGTLQESFGLAALEAAMMDLPLLALRVGALPYVLGEQYPGLIETDKAEAIMDHWISFASGNPPFSSGKGYRSALAARFGRVAWEQRFKEMFGFEALPAVGP